jgi:hypothetical protein
MTEAEIKEGKQAILQSWLQQTKIPIKGKVKTYVKDLAKRIGYTGVEVAALDGVPR